MQLDIQWKLVITQLVAFLIVLWILRKYAWGKLLGLLEARREHIASEFESIEKGKADVETLREKYDKELADIDTTARARIQEAVSEANELAAGIKEDARKEAVALRVKTNEDIDRELDKANVELRDRMVGAVITATERLIKERLDSGKHKQLISEFLDEVDVKAQG
jgi:F-type H+-transporting ATPase subunit b